MHLYEPYSSKNSKLTFIGQYYKNVHTWLLSMTSQTRGTQEPVSLTWFSIIFEHHVKIDQNHNRYPNNDGG